MEQVGGSRRLIFSFPSFSAAVPMETMKNDRPSRKLSTGFCSLKAYCVTCDTAAAAPARELLAMCQKGISFETLRHAIGEVK